ncbi:MAG: adenylyltransferase/cytidyltransferase family protein [Rectinemataceae bacterium]
MSRVYVSGAFDEAGSRQIRFLQEAARLGPVTLFLWPDQAVARIRGSLPKMGLAERVYYFEALSYVDRVEAAPLALDPDRIEVDPGDGSTGEAAVWALSPAIGTTAEAPNAVKLSWCRSRGLELREIPESALAGFPYEAPPYSAPRAPGRKRVIVTGCYDWLHTGHLRFFEEASAYGELNVVIGSDANVRLLKGEGHPLFSEAERSYVVGSFRGVARCLVSSGKGWLDAEPEIHALGIERYVVNEDGDKAEKRRYCEEKGIEYIVLKRTPKEGLPRRRSTDLRGF